MLVSFYRKCKVIPSMAETVVVTDDVYEEVLKHVLLAVSHSPE